MNTKARLLTLLFYLLYSIGSFAQIVLPQDQVDNEFRQVLEEVQTSPCDCDVLLISSLIRSELSQLPPGTTTILPENAGDLDDFEGPNCTNRTVEVLTNRNDLIRDFRPKDLNQVLQLSENSDQVCLLGHFFFSETINLAQNNILRLLDNTVIQYIGDGNDPPILIDESNSSIVGDGGTNVLFTFSPTPNGFIQINSDDITSANRDNAFSTLIRNVRIASLSNSNGPRDHIGIVLINEPESLRLVEDDNGVLRQRSSDRGSNYDTQISNVSISGFNTGIHLTGFSNATHIREVDLSGIRNIGLWLSGTVDNSISYVSLRNSLTATAVRIDNYVHTVWDLADDNTVNLHGIELSVTEPNCRFEITVADIFEEHLALFPIPGINAQDEFREDLNNLHPYLYGMIAERCALANQVNQNNEITRMGLFDYEEDATTNYANYDNDDLTISDALFDPNQPSVPDESINVFEQLPSTTNTIIAPTCSNDPILSRNFLRPVANVLSYINVFDENGEIQVASGVEVWDRSDDLPLCEYTAQGDWRMRNCNNPPPCDVETRCDFGNNNKIRFCRPDGTEIDMEENFVRNNTSAPCPLQINEGDDIALGNQDPNETLPRGLSVRFH